MALTNELEASLMVLLAQDDLRVRTQAANALGAAANRRPEKIPDTLTKLFDLYRKCVPAAPLPGSSPPRRLPGEALQEVEWQTRQGVALSLGALGWELKVTCASSVPIATVLCPIITQRCNPCMRSSIPAAASPPPRRMSSFLLFSLS